MIEKSKEILSAVLYHVDISKQYFLVYHLKIVWVYFLHELQPRSSDVTGQHWRPVDSDVNDRGSNNDSK